MNFERPLEAIAEEFQTEERERLAEAAGSSGPAKNLAELLLLASLAASSPEVLETDS